MWYSSIDGSPGISGSALDTLRERAESYKDEKGHKLHICLISDEMAIRKQITWAIEKSCFTGFATITSASQHPNAEEQNEYEPTLKVAKDALVFLVVGPDFKLPVAYHLLNGLESIDRAAMTLEVVRSIEGTGAIVMSITSDGLRANVTVAELLGAKFSEKISYFTSPTYPTQRIYFIFDPPHMLKLVRKQFSSGKLYHEDRLLDWDFLSILAQKQSSVNFNLTNKLTHRHINWKQKPMNVELAAQTISNSVADSIEQLCSDGYEDFKNADATVEFLRKFNNVFDILNFAEKDVKRGYKLPVCRTTAGTIFSYLECFKKFTEDLKIATKTTKKNILGSKEQMGFLGFYIDAISLEGIYLDFVQNGSLEEFCTKQFSQDHIETLFSLIRNSVGRNDNPNTIEFRAAFRKLLVCYPLLTSLGHNVISNASKILTVSSAAKKRPPPAIPIQSEFILEVPYQEIIGEELAEMQPFDQHMCAFAASNTEQRVTRDLNRSSKSNCSKCALIFSQNDKISDALLAKKNIRFAQIDQPCQSTLTLVIFSNALMKVVPSGINKDYNSLGGAIYDNLNIDDLYTASDFEHNGEDHKEEFVRKVIFMFLTLKSESISKRLTDEQQGDLMRNRLKAYTHLSGQ